MQTEDLQFHQKGTPSQVFSVYLAKFKKIFLQNISLRLPQLEWRSHRNVHHWNYKSKSWLEYQPRFLAPGMKSRCCFVLPSSEALGCATSFTFHVKLFRLVLIIPKIKSKLTVTINGIKLALVTDISLFFTFTSFVWSNKMYWGYLWRNGIIVLFMTKSKWNQSVHINLNINLLNLFFLCKNVCKGF